MSQPESGVDRDNYPDALRAGALLVVVFGHWLATLPRLENGRTVATDHLLDVWQAAGVMTWVLQVVPVFVFVSAAVSAPGVLRRRAEGVPHLHWWGERALGLARPTVTYLAVLVALALPTLWTSGRLMGPLDHSLTVHLWFLVMLLAVQALLPWGVAMDQRFGLKAVLGLVLVAVVADLVRSGATSPGDLRDLGELVTSNRGGVGWVNALVVWLIPQQLGIAWRNGRFGGWRAGAVMLGLGAGWLALAVGSGYPVSMVGYDAEGHTNLIPPTLALVGVMWVQCGLVLLAEAPARRALGRRRIGKVVGIVGALGMGLYLWHKLAELPAAMLGERLGLPIDAGVPGEPEFWTGRLLWILLCLLVVTPVMAGVIAFETRRSPDVVAATSTPVIIAGGLCLLTGLALALALGARPGAYFGLAGVAAASWLLRQHPRLRSRVRA
ncbi:acyltransferase family protein [Nocardioides limicola]|uniref:acyltransferase family protein n=1 Tax=Nocardioides limicola TaxID=2803368 RepID=UPI00193C0572|nr:acyltransferase family protein [Nocardioides sp. DJM-14]